MRFSTAALSKTKDLANHTGQRVYHAITLSKRHVCSLESISCSRNFTTSRISNQSHAGRFKSRHREASLQETMIENRDLLNAVLDSSATKRDAKAYLQNFSPNTLSSTKAKTLDSNKTGDVAGATLAVRDTPRFIQHPDRGKMTPDMVAPLHIALIKIRCPQSLSDEILSGIGRTLSQLAKLGLISTIVVDCEDGSFLVQNMNTQEWKDMNVQQTDRIVAAIDSHGGQGARKVDEMLSIADNITQTTETSHTQKITSIMNKKFLMKLLRAGTMPVLPAFGYTSSYKLAPADPNDVVLALIRDFSSFQPPSLPDADPKLVADMLRALQHEVSCERLIILDPLGGIPQADPDRPNRHHVFLNMEQEYLSVRQELAATPAQQGSLTPATTLPVTDLANSNPLSRFVETEFASPKSEMEAVKAPEVPNAVANTNRIHLDNLDLTKSALELLPDRSSVVLTTPLEASNSGKFVEPPNKSIQEVATRRKRNPLIHNLLTDKPAFSSSLPSHRLRSGSPSPNQSTYRTNPTTLAKRGMALTMFPDPRIDSWQPPGSPGGAVLSLNDPRINFDKLVHLIDDSFGRKLDVKAYLDRIRNRVAGVIIAGDYEGGALLTWELPPGVPDDDSPSSRARYVPYLDKFAVLRRSQGAGGVADIVFTAMVRTCFPRGVCWRSRKDNPVNKWYFERSTGTWKIPDTNWTMFWTTPDLQKPENMSLFADYEAVCRSIQPTWADKKSVVD